MLSIFTQEKRGLLESFVEEEEGKEKTKNKKKKNKEKEEEEKPGE